MLELWIGKWAEVQNLIKSNYTVRVVWLISWYIIKMEYANIIYMNWFFVLR